jgi:hypothetical protein
MEFTLYYDGRLTANAKAKYKHELRKHFHAQLKELWDQEPLSLVRDDLLKGSGPGQPPVVPVQRKNSSSRPWSTRSCILWWTWISPCSSPDHPVR